MRVARRDGGSDAAVIVSVDVLFLFVLRLFESYGELCDVLKLCRLS